MSSKQKFYLAKWSWPSDTEEWLEQKFKGLSVLNFPCGMSQVGTIRADIDPDVKPDIVCCLQYPPFKDGAVDVLITDPPYSMFNKFKWLFQLQYIPKRYLLLSTPNLTPNFRHFTKRFYIAAKNNSLFIRIFVQYTRKTVNNSILDYIKPKKLYKKRLTKRPTLIN